MTVTSIHKNTERLTLTVTSEFDAPAERVWQLWQDPRLLERWWGPPTYPATVLEHDLSPGGSVTYLMTGPEGDQHRGWWRIISVDPLRHLELEDGFADAEGVPNTEMPTTLMSVSIGSDGPGRTTMVMESTFPSLEAMEQMVAMGMEEGIREAMGQIDALL
jgi:uncharacterized protein YndB with AHSA1/START domain